MPVKHVVMFSGGVGSFAAAQRVIERYGKKDVTLLFTDTKIEDEDLYRFLDDCEDYFGIPITRIADGRTPWQVFYDEKKLGNTLEDPCSKILKRKLGDKWLVENCDPDNTVVYLGIDWTEKHRFDNGNRGAKHRYASNGWKAEAPMCERPYIMKSQMVKLIKQAGIKPPRLYAMGFAHNNCGGFCVKAGKGHFALLLRQMPERYLYHEAEEQKFMKFSAKGKGKGRTILRDRVKGNKTKPLSLRQLRLSIEGGTYVDETDEVGGCGCFVDAPHKRNRKFFFEEK